MGTSLIGKIAMCRDGIKAIITKRIKVKVRPDFTITEYHGLSFNGEPWQTIEPLVIANNFQDYINKLTDPGQYT